MLDRKEQEFFSVPLVRILLDLGMLICSLSEDGTGDFVKDEYPFTSSNNMSSSFCGSPEG